MTVSTCHPPKPATSRGLCSSCYQKLRASPGFFAIGKVRKPTTCGHDRPQVGGGKCQACYSKEHKARDPVRRARWFLRAKLAVYGLTPESFAAIVEQQGNLCGLCRRAFKSSVDTQVDHCHQTGRVRGVLCFTCNKALGMFGDNEAGIQRALAYLQQPARKAA
jgi:hypothetical protein